MVLTSEDGKTTHEYQIINGHLVIKINGYCKNGKNGRSIKRFTMRAPIEQGHDLYHWLLNELYREGK